jgi:hypothetical protein
MQPMEMEAREDKRLTLVGKGVSPGLAKGKAFGPYMGES